MKIPSPEPILESQPRHLLEISPIGREKKRIIGRGDAGHLQIHGTDLGARFAEVAKGQDEDGSRSSKRLPPPLFPPGGGPSPAML